MIYQPVQQNKDNRTMSNDMVLVSPLSTLSTSHILCLHHWLQEADASRVNNYYLTSCTTCGNMTHKENLKLSQGHSSQIHQIHIKSKILKSLKYSPFGSLIDSRKFHKFYGQFRDFSFKIWGQNVMSICWVT